MSISKKKCCVHGCMESGRSHRSLHTFPNPAKDRDRFNQWIYAIGGDIIGLDNENIYKYRSVCHVHFEEKYCCRYNRLSNIAVPTLYLPGSLSLPNFSTMMTLTTTCSAPQPIPVHSDELFTLVCPSAPSTKEILLSTERSAIMVTSTPAYSAPQPVSGHSSEPSILVCTAAPTTSDIFLTGVQNHTLAIINDERSAPMNENSFKTLIPVARKNSQTHQECNKVNVAHVNQRVKMHVKMTLTEQKLRRRIIKLQTKLSKYREKVKKQSSILKAATKLFYCTCVKCGYLRVNTERGSKT